MGTIFHRGTDYSTGARYRFKQVLCKKLHQLRRRVELFCFSYTVKLKVYFTGASCGERANIENTWLLPLLRGGITILSDFYLAT